MLKRLAIAALLIGAFAYGLTQLFLLRFTTGDVYPPYCSLRADPIGAKAFHDALAAMPHLDVRRNFRAIGKLRPTGPTTLFYAGTPHQAYWGNDELLDVEALAASGTRVVITMLPVQRGPTDAEERWKKDVEKKRREEQAKKRAKKKKDEPPAKPDENKDAKPPVKADEAVDDDDETEFIPFSKVAARWGFEFKFLLPRDEKAPPRRAKSQMPGAETEAELSWHSALHFGKLGGEWRAVYAFEGLPLVIERDYGKGSIVLASDSYFLSNEALRNERAPRLLAWLAGPSSLIVFDEDSHGISEDPGIATLVRKYGLHGVAAGLLLIALLFIWKNGTQFIPPHDELNTDGDLVIGREAEEGFINLLRRSIAPAQLLAVCAAEWKKACDHTGKSLKTAHLDKVISSETSKPRDPVAAYRTISQVLSKTK